MRKVPIDKIEDGMILAKPLVGTTGNILLNEGVILKGSMVSRLKNWDVPVVYVESENEHAVDPENTSTVAVSTTEIDEIFMDVMKNPLMKTIYEAAKDYSSNRATPAS